jgi:hypothetical protein
MTKVSGKYKTVIETGNPKTSISFPAVASETSWKVMYNTEMIWRKRYGFIRALGACPKRARPCKKPHGNTSTHLSPNDHRPERFFD